MSPPKDYIHQDLAPYWRFQKRNFYGGVFTADVMFCNWTCDNCWSKFGWRNQPPKYELTSEEAAERLLKGVRRNQVPQARITGGEPAIYWQNHMSKVAETFLLETEGERIARREVFLVIETNGTVMTARNVSTFEKRVGDPAERLQLTVGLKALRPERLADLTGQTAVTSARFHEQQMRLVDFLAGPDRLVQLNVVLLDAYCDEDEIERYREHLENICEGASETIDVQKFRTSGWGSKKHSEKHYKPKRRRA